MFVNRKRILVEFGDCDPAGIVFFANYFRWFDDCTTALFLAAGFPIAALFSAHGVVGIPVVEATARFLAPSTQGDALVVESSVTDVRTSSFVIEHRFYHGRELLLEGKETRVWATEHPAKPGRLKAQPLPQELVTKLTGKRTKAAKKRPGARRGR